MNQILEKRRSGEFSATEAHARWFIKRHNISLVTPLTIDSIKLQSSSKETMEDYFILLAHILNNGGYRGEMMDETNIEATRRQTKVLATKENKSTKYHYINDEGKMRHLTITV